MLDPVLLVQGLSVNFGSAQALHDVTLVIEPGERIGLLGRNGAGKSTLFDAIVGAVRPNAGQLVYGKGVLTSQRRWRAWRACVGLLPQRFAFDPALTAHQTVEYAAWLQGVPKSGRDHKVKAALDAVAMSSSAQSSRMSKLSGGMVQRVGLASALVHEPSVLLLDEPTTSLDIEQRAVFRDLLLNMDTRAAVLMSSHLTEDLAATCERLLIIERGRIVRDGPTHEVCGLSEESAVTGQELEAAFQRILQELPLGRLS